MSANTRMSERSLPEVDEKVLVQARKLGMYGNVEARIQEMARQAAPFTHPDGNRRFESYLMHIVQGRVVSLRKLDYRRAKRRGREQHRGRTLRPFKLPVFTDAVKCRECKGTMHVKVAEIEEDGTEVIVRRPCPRFHDKIRPLCSPPTYSEDLE